MEKINHSDRLEDFLSYLEDVRKEYEDNLKNREKLENELADVQEAMRKAGI